MTAADDVPLVLLPILVKEPSVAAAKLIFASCNADRLAYVLQAFNEGFGSSSSSHKFYMMQGALGTRCFASIAAARNCGQTEACICLALLPSTSFLADN